MNEFIKMINADNCLRCNKYCKTECFFCNKKCCTRCSYSSTWINNDRHYVCCMENECSDKDSVKYNKDKMLKNLIININIKKSKIHHKKISDMIKHEEKYCRYNSAMWLYNQLIPGQIDYIEINEETVNLFSLDVGPCKKYCPPHMLTRLTVSEMKELCNSYYVKSKELLTFTIKKS